MLCKPNWIDPFTVFSTFDWGRLAKIRQHSWKERLKISTVVKFQSCLLKTYEGIAPQSCAILQTFVWWAASFLPSPRTTTTTTTTTVQTSVKFHDFRGYIFSRFRRIAFKLGKFNLLMFRRTFQRCQLIIAQSSLSKPEMVYFHRFSVDISTMGHWGWWLGMNLSMDSTQAVIFYVSSNYMKALNYSLLTNVSAGKKTV